MPRIISPTFLAQLKSTGASAPLLFVVLSFANETLYMFSGIGTLTPAGPPFNALSSFPYGQTFTGLGWLGRISAIPQTTQVAAQSVTLALSGIPAELVSDAVAQVRITGTATIFLGFLDSTGALIKDPTQLFAGSLDVPTLDDSGETSTITITAENPLLLLNEAPNRQFDDLDQQIYHPGDLGFSFVDTLGNRPLYWPAPASYGSVWPVDMIMSPNGADIAVGGTVTIQTRINYSDGSYFEKPSLTGSGSSWVGGPASSNPKIASLDSVSFGLVTGRSPGICLISMRSVYFNGSGQPAGTRRVACTVIVHS